MKYFASVILIFITQTQAHSELRAQWNSFKELHQKSYTTLEEVERFNIFEENLAKIQKHNELYEKNEVSFKMGLNQFADLTSEEFKHVVLKSKPNDKKVSEKKQIIKPLDSDIPDELDWREKGAVAQVENQRACATSWVYTLTGALEGQNFIQNGKLIPLSEQELADCVSDSGCDGGDIDQGYDYVQDNGLAAETDYPSNSNNTTCHRGSISSAVKEYGSVWLYGHGQREFVKESIAAVGPLAVQVYAESWQFYSSGILECGELTGLYIDALAVGYGTDYYLLKNSWGPGWGEEGYIRIAVGNEVDCGIMRYVTYPIVGKDGK